MNQQDLDRMLSRQEDIIPSSVFVDSVMEAINRAASTPPPIPFPWRHALPGFLASLIAAAALVFFAFTNYDAHSANQSFPGAPPFVVAFLGSYNAFNGGWIAIALLLSAVSIFFSIRIVNLRA